MRTPMLVTPAERAAVAAARLAGAVLTACSLDEAAALADARRFGRQVVAVTARELLAVLLSRGRRRSLVALDASEAARLRSQRATHLAHVAGALYGERDDGGAL